MAMDEKDLKEVRAILKEEVANQSAETLKSWREEIKQLLNSETLPKSLQVSLEKMQAEIKAELAEIKKHSEMQTPPLEEVKGEMDKTGKPHKRRKADQAEPPANNPPPSEGDDPPDQGEPLHVPKRKFRFL